MKLFKLPLLILLSLLVALASCTKDDQENVENEIPELTPVYEVYHNGERILEMNLEDILNPSDQDNWEKIELVYGDSLTFKDVTTVGEPTGRTWNFNGSETTTSTEKEVIVVYTEEGTHTAGDVTFVREGSDFPDASITSEIPLNIQVSVPEMKAAFKVMKGDEVILTITEEDEIEEDDSKWTSIQLNKGEVLTFIDLSKEGMPTERTWSLNGVDLDDATVEEAAAVYATVGEFKAGMLKLMRSDTDYPDASLEITIPLHVEVIIPELKAGIHVFKGDDLDTPIYEIIAGEDGKASTFTIENGEKLTYKVTSNDETVTYTWSINNGSDLTSNDKTFPVVYATDGEFESQSLTLKRDGQDDETVLIPLTIKVVTSPEITPIVKVYLNDKMDAPVYEYTDEATAASIMIEKGDKLTFKETSTGEVSERTWSVDNGEESSSDVASFEVNFNTVGEFTSHSLELKRMDHVDYVDAEVTIQLPLTVKVIETPDLALGISVYKNDDMDAAVYEVFAGNTPSAQTIEIKNGDKLTFVDRSNGAANARLWTLNNGTEVTSSEESYQVKYSTDGEFTGAMLKLTRSGHVDYEDAEETFDIPLTVKVSTDIVEISKEGGISVEKTVTEKVISFSVEEELADIADADVAKSAFTVMIENQESGLAATSFDVASVVINSSDRKIVELRLTEEIYNSDVITVEYKGAEDFALVTAEGARLANFNAEEATTYNRGNILQDEYTGFEVEKTQNLPYAEGWYNQQQVTTWNRTDENVNTGNYSIKFYAENKDILHDQRDRVQTVGTIQPISDKINKGDKIRVSFYIYVPTSNTIQEGLSIIFISPQLNSTKISLENVPRDQWYQINTDIEMSDDVTNADPNKPSFGIFINKNNVTGVSDTDPIEFFVDDVKIEHYEVRP
ncbi:hypothetical protein [Flammeovirga pacifica]|uniref:PKD domain-containing protein n=1 Tax=Flammeovirga pacifica TaxID=915059 RepID=A0A1S1YTC1_FLAPC|nr:hypothetical protein [Flammeovirga pacifica]OHX64281.1 hypothetical protein NH26_22020 [Flammeovirga pacifica]